MKDLVLEVLSTYMKGDLSNEITVKNNNILIKLADKTIAKITIN